MRLSDLDSTESPVNISFEIQPISHHKSSILKCLFWPTSLELYIAAYLTKIHQQMPEICKNHFCLEKFGQIWRENDAKSWGQELTCSVLLFCTNKMFFSSAFITLYWQTFVIGIVFLVRNSLSALEPHSMDSLGHQHCAKKLSPKIILHFKVLCESKATLP